MYSKMEKWGFRVGHVNSKPSRSHLGHVSSPVSASAAPSVNWADCTRLRLVVGSGEQDVGLFCLAPGVGIQAYWVLSLTLQGLQGL